MLFVHRYCYLWSLDSGDICPTSYAHTPYTNLPLFLFSPEMIGLCPLQQIWVCPHMECSTHITLLIEVFPAGQWAYIGKMPPKARSIRSNMSGHSAAATAPVPSQPAPSQPVAYQLMPPPPSPGPLQALLQPALVPMERERPHSKSRFLSKSFTAPSTSPVNTEVPASPTAPAPAATKAATVAAPSTLEVSATHMLYSV
jgi:hypothetical protein